MKKSVVLLVTAVGIKDRDGKRERQTGREPPLFFNAPGGLYQS